MNNTKARSTKFTHIGDIIPGVLSEIEKKRVRIATKVSVEETADKSFSAGDVIYVKKGERKKDESK